VQDGSPATAQAAVGSLGEASADLRVEAVPLPGVHGDVAGEGVEEAEVLVRGVAVLPVEVASDDVAEQAAVLDLRAVVRGPALLSVSPAANWDDLQTGNRPMARS